ncbi:MAG: VanZ family protein [Microbacterium sp.]
MHPPRRATRIVTLAFGIPFLTVIAFLALTPRRIEERIPNVLDVVLGAAHRVGWHSLDFTALEVIANILVFIPIGMIAYVFTPHRRWTLAYFIGPALSVSIELTQLLALPNRVPSLADVAENVLGATIGVSVCAIMSTLVGSPASARSIPETA